MSLYAQLEALEPCGITLNADVGIPDLLAVHGERAYETSPFRRLLEVMGGGSQTQLDTPLSSNVWRVSVGCFAGPGDYVRVAQRMSLLAGGDLPMSNISDEFDLRRGIAWLRFRSAARDYEWPARIQERWVDPFIFTRFVGLLDQQDTERRFTHLDLGGQDVLIGCSTPEQFTRLRQVTGVPFEWLG
jgi:hypothetical protein